MSLIYYRPIEMMKPKKLALLIFVQRGWVGRYRHLRPRFNRSRRYYHALNRTFPGMSPTLSDWMGLGAVRRTIVSGCDIETRYEITALGTEILNSAPREVLDEARAFFRACIWAQILQNRKERRRRPLVAAEYALRNGMPEALRRVNGRQCARSEE